MSALPPVEFAPEEPRRSKVTPVLGAIAAVMVIVGALFTVRARSAVLAMAAGSPGSPIFPTDMVIPARARAFVWHSAPGLPRYVMELMAADSVIFADTLRDTTTTLPHSFVLGNGDYVWSVRVLAADSSGAALSRLFSVRTP
jgi:hypothetical protein